MASIISAGTSSGTALNMTADTSGQLQLATGASATTAVTIDTSQNVGIGTTSPSSKLEVYSTSAGSGGNATYPGSIVINTGLTGLNNTGANGLEFKSSNYLAGYGQLISSINVPSGGTQLVFANRQSSATWTEMARFDNLGNLLVGTTTSGGVGMTFSPGTVGAPVMTFNKSYNGGVGVLNCNYNGANVGGISMTNSATAFNTTSDYRLKENVLPMTNALEKVAQLKPVTYTWKADGTAGQGFIAHELAEIVPDCVTGEKDAVNEDGSIKPQAIDTSFLVATLTAAIQELTERVKALESK